MQAEQKVIDPAGEAVDEERLKVAERSHWKSWPGIPIVGMNKRW